MPAKGAHGEAGGTHDSEHNAALVTVLDGFEGSLMSVSKPYSKAYAIIPGLGNSWGADLVATSILPDDPDKAAIALEEIRLIGVGITPVMLPIAMLAGAIEPLNKKGGGMPPISVPGFGEFGDPDLATPFADMDPVKAPVLAGALSGMVLGVVFKLPITMLKNTLAGSPPVGPGFGILEAIAPLFGDGSTEGPGFEIGVSAATYMASCLADRFVPLEAYEPDEGEEEGGGEEATSEGEGEGEGTP